jgi:hypothetical protein
MSVSSINPYLTALAGQYSTNAASSSGIDQTASNSGSLQGVSGLDSFELSAPPIAFPGYDSSGNSTGGSSLKADIRAFLDKVKTGTVTDDDIKKLQDELKQADQTSDSALTAGSTGSSSSDIRSDIQSFLGKVKDGSLTQSDIQTMQTELQQAGPPSGPSPDAVDDNGVDSLKADIKGFLDKVKDGSVTQSDIQTIQQELQQDQQQSGSSGAHRRHQQEGGSSFGSDLSSFLDKVANGTITDADLQSFQSELQQNQQESGNS